jgi:hypothetical protein
VFQKDKLPVPELNDIGSGVTGNYERWAKTCGTHYVDEIRKGGKFFFSIKIDFGSRSEKQQFEANFKIEGPAVGVNATLQQASEHFSKRSKVTVSVYQYGGDVEKVSGVFANTEDARQSYVSCSLGHFEACASVLQNALAYATDVEKGFPSQLKDSAKRSTLSYDVTEYTASGLYKDPPPGLEDLVLLKRQELAQNFETQYRRRKLADAMLNTNPGPPRRDQLRVAAKLLDSNLRKIVTASTVCYEDPKSCPDTVDSLILDEFNLDVFGRLHMWEFCREAYLHNVDIRPTIVGLLLDEPYFDPRSNQVPNDCYDPTDTSHHFIVGAIDGTASVVDLDHSHLVKKYQGMPVITDISPLQASSSYTDRVFLAHNKVEDIDALALISELAELDLDNNRVSDLRPVGMCKHLSRLSASGNQLSDLQPLAGLNELRRLYLANNLVSDPSSISKLPRLEVLNLSHNQIADIKSLSSLPELQVLDVSHNLIQSLKGFAPIRLQSLYAYDNQFPTDDVLAFCEKSKGTTIYFTGEDGKKTACQISKVVPEEGTTE